MTDPNFDVEKRRRGYAASLGALSSFSFVTVFLISEDIGNINEALWMSALTLFAFWLFFFMFKFIAGYALWYRPFNSRWRAVGLSLVAVFLVYFFLTSITVGYFAVKGNAFNLINSLTSFVTFHKNIYGIPYIVAAIVGWTFARPPPDACEHF